MNRNSQQDRYDRMLHQTKARYYLPDDERIMDRELIKEEPFSINIQGKTYAMVMRTPGDEKAHAAGFCFAEGLIDAPNDLEDIALCDGEDSNVAAVKLTRNRKKKVSHLLEKQSYISQTSCGICGKEIIEDLTAILKPVNDTMTISFSQAMAVVARLKEIQQLRRRCFSSHAAALFNRNLKKLSEAEDAGRHNALDKAVGKLFLTSQLSSASIALLSSRASYEMIQKCARAGIEIVLSMARPTALAAQLGAGLNMTLASVRDDGLYVFTGRKRITREKDA